MKTTDLQNALSNVDDKYIAEAVSYKRASGALKIWRAIAIAACCVIAVPLTALAAFTISDLAGSSGKSSSQAAGSYADTTIAETAAAAPGMGYYEAAAEDGMYAEDIDYENTASADSGSGISSAGEAADSNAKIILTADISMQSTEYDSALDAINRLVASCGGYFESRDLYDGSGSYRNAYLSVRVPSEKYNEFLEGLKGTGTVVSQSESADDVSDSYYDIQSRLETARTKLARLQELLSRAEDMSDIITIEDAISETEYEIDYLQGSLNSYDSRISYSSVYIYLQEVYKVENNETPVTFGERLSAAFHNGLESFGDFLGDAAIWFAESWIVLLLIGLIIAAAIVIPITCVRAARRRRNR